MGRMEAHSPLNDLAWPVRTPRLTLRRALDADAGAVFAYRSLEPVARWLTRIQTDRETWAEAWPRRLESTVIAEHDGRVIGDARLVIRDADTQAEVALRGERAEAELMWAFDPAWHGHGYATETVKALIEIGIGTLGLRRLTAVCYADNAPSWRLMERVGMRREGHSVRSSLTRDGIWRDFLTYALLAPDA